jgi:hypothetical protein
MQFNLNTLQRLATLYDVLERQDLIGLQRCTTAVLEVNEAIENQDSLIRAAKSDVRQAIGIGDRAGALLAAVHCEIASRQRTASEEVLREREEQRESARQRYFLRRLKRAQVLRLIETGHGRAAAEEARRQQSALDERFLLGKRWRQKRVR